MPNCRYCEEEIEWEQVEDHDGYEARWRPMDPLTHLPHRCRERQSIWVPSNVKCYRCNQAIAFGDRIGRNGKKIPLDPDTREAHRCPGT